MFSKWHHVIKFALLVTLIAQVGALNAHDAHGVPAERPAALVQMLDSIQAMRPDANMDELADSVVDGYYELHLSDLTIYIEKSGDHFFDGNLVSQRDGVLLSETEASRATRRSDKIAEIPSEEMIIFSPEDEVRAVLNVFTDVTCGYCQKLHSEIADLNEQGIEVRYIAWPRSGLGTYEAEMTTTAWCADDRSGVMTALKLGQYRANPLECVDNPVSRHYAIGQQVGVTGTPAIILESGAFVPGYRPVSEFLNLLGLEEI